MANPLTTLLKGIKRPWQITGIASTADYLDYLPKSGEYRKHSPGSQPVDAIIPHDVPQFVFNTRYYVRDYRRHNKYTMRTVDRAPLDLEKMLSGLPLKPEDVTYSPYETMVRDRGV